MKHMPRNIALDTSGIAVTFRNSVTLKQRQAFWRTLQRFLDVSQAGLAQGVARETPVVDPITGEKLRTSALPLTFAAGMALLPAAAMIPSDWSGRMWQNSVRFSPCGEIHVDVLTRMRFKFESPGIVWDFGREDIARKRRTRQTGLGFTSKPSTITF